MACGVPCRAQLLYIMTYQCLYLAPVVSYFCRKYSYSPSAARTIAHMKQLISRNSTTVKPSQLLKNHVKTSSIKHQYTIIFINYRLISSNPCIVRCSFRHLIIGINKLAPYIVHSCFNLCIRMHLSVCSLLSHHSLRAIIIVISIILHCYGLLSVVRVLFYRISC